MKPAIVQGREIISQIGIELNEQQYSLLSDKREISSNAVAAICSHNDVSTNSSFLERLPIAKTIIEENFRPQIIAEAFTMLLGREFYPALLKDRQSNIGKALLSAMAGRPEDIKLCIHLLIIDYLQDQLPR